VQRNAWPADGPVTVNRTVTLFPVGGASAPPTAAAGPTLDFGRLTYLVIVQSGGRLGFVGLVLRGAPQQVLQGVLAAAWCGSCFELQQSQLPCSRSSRSLRKRLGVCASSISCSADKRQTDRSQLHTAAPARRQLFGTNCTRTPEFEFASKQSVKQLQPRPRSKSEKPPRVAVEHNIQIAAVQAWRQRQRHASTNTAGCRRHLIGYSNNVRLWICNLLRCRRGVGGRWHASTAAAGPRRHFSRNFHEAEAASSDTNLAPQAWRQRPPAC